MKALVEAGADITIKNVSGHDAVFLAERAAWDADASVEVENENEQTKEVEIPLGEMTLREGEGQASGSGSGSNQPAESAGEMSEARQVVEWLLGSEKAAVLESGDMERYESGTDTVHENS